MGERVCPIAATLESTVIGETVVKRDFFNPASDASQEEDNRLINEFRKTSQEAASLRCKACGIAPEYEGTAVLEECPKAARIKRRSLIRLAIASF